MSCVSPLEAWKIPGRGIQFGRGGIGSGYPILLPCGQCIECRLSRSREWAVRCVHESKLHRFNSYVTLTWDDEHLPGPSLVYEPWQAFAKRVRRKLGPFRFMMCGEYGEENRRPHYHALMFGVHFADRREFKKSPSGAPLYVSECLSGLWPYGHSSVGDVTFESAAYVARYVCKKVNGERAGVHYSAVDPRTGEVITLAPEFGHCSNGGRSGDRGIGFRFFERYHGDMTSRDGVVMRGHEMNMPRYYDKLWRKLDPEGLEAAKLRREAQRVRGENAPARLLARKAVAEARLAFKKRGKV